jgi:ribosomal protein L29
LRKENELLKLNLQVVLEQVRAQEAELQTLKKQVAAVKTNQDVEGDRVRLRKDLFSDILPEMQADFFVEVNRDNLAKVVEAALKGLRNGSDKDAPRHAAEPLEKALKKVKEKAPEKKKPKGNNPEY